MLKHSLCLLCVPSNGIQPFIFLLKCSSIIYDYADVQQESMYYSQSLCNCSPGITNVKPLPLCSYNKDVAFELLKKYIYMLLISAIQIIGTKHGNLTTLSLKSQNLWKNNGK